MGWGDELIVTGMAREAQERDARRRKIRPIYDTAKKFHEAWLNNPRICQPGEKATTLDLIVRRGFLRPYIADKTPQKWTWKPWGPPKGELFFTEEEKAFAEPHANAIVIEPNLKTGASPNKQWGWERWQSLANLLTARGHRLTQLGAQGTRLLAGVSYIETKSMRLAAAIIARARGIIVPEGAMHHVAAAVGTPAVVIFGGYISPEVTGYEGQKNFYVESQDHRYGCGMRVPCRHCEEAMGSIQVENVAAAFDEVVRV